MSGGNSPERELPYGRSSCTIGGMQATHALLPGTQAPLPGPEVAFTGLAAFAFMMIPFLWPLVDHFDTMAHEGAHAVVASARGHRLRNDLAAAAVRHLQRRGSRRTRRGCRTALHDHSPAPLALGPAVDRGRAPGHRHRRKMAGLAVLNYRVTGRSP